MHIGPGDIVLPLGNMKGESCITSSMVLKQQSNLKFEVSGEEQEKINYLERGPIGTGIVVGKLLWKIYP